MKYGQNNNNNKITNVYNCLDFYYPVFYFFFLSFYFEPAHPFLLSFNSNTIYVLFLLSLIFSRFFLFFVINGCNHQYSDTNIQIWFLKIFYCTFLFFIHETSEKRNCYWRYWIVKKWETYCLSHFYTNYKIDKNMSSLTW